jgi:hypothetical protein
VARSGAGTSAAPAMTRPNASSRPMIPTAPEPIGSPKTRIPPRIADRLAATEVIAITGGRGQADHRESCGGERHA